MTNLSSKPIGEKYIHVQRRPIIVHVWVFVTHNTLKQNCDAANETADYSKPSPKYHKQRKLKVHESTRGDDDTDGQFNNILQPVLSKGRNHNCFGRANVNASYLLICPYTQKARHSITTECDDHKCMRQYVYTPESYR